MKLRNIHKMEEPGKWTVKIAESTEMVTSTSYPCNDKKMMHEVCFFDQSPENIKSLAD